MKIILMSLNAVKNECVALERVKTGGLRRETVESNICCALVDSRRNMPFILLRTEQCESAAQLLRYLGGGQLAACLSASCSPVLVLAVGAWCW